MATLKAINVNFGAYVDPFIAAVRRASETMEQFGARIEQVGARSRTAFEDRTIAQALRDSITPAERLEARLAALHKGLADGRLTMDQYGAALNKALDGAAASQQKAGGFRGAIDGIHSSLKLFKAAGVIGIVGELVRAFSELGKVQEEYHKGMVESGNMYEAQRRMFEALPLGLGETYKGMEKIASSGFFGLIGENMNNTLADAEDRANRLAAIVKKNEEKKAEWKAAADAAAKAREPIDQQIAALERQSATLNMTERQIALYEAAQHNATRADLERINAVYDTLEADAAAKKAIEDQAKATEELAAQWKAYYDDLESRANRWLEAIKTPFDRYRESMEDITALYWAGKLNADQYARALDYITDQLNKASEAKEKATKDEPFKFAAFGGGAEAAYSATLRASFADFQDPTSGSSLEESKKQTTLLTRLYQTLDRMSKDDQPLLN